MRFFKLSILLVSLFSFSLMNCNDEDVIAVNLKDGKKSDKAPFSLEGNYPNPCNSQTVISFTVYSEMDLKIKIYSEDWIEIRTIFDSHVDLNIPNEPVHSYSKKYSVFFEGTNSSGKLLPSGDYYYTLEGDGYTQVRVMTIVK